MGDIFFLRKIGLISFCRFAAITKLSLGREEGYMGNHWKHPFLEGNKQFVFLAAKKHV